MHGINNRNKCRAELETAHTTNNTEVHVRTGVKYGSDFLVYLGMPSAVHSSFTLTADAELSYKVLSALVRVSSTAKKDAVLYTDTHIARFVRCSRFFL